VISTASRSTSWRMRKTKTTTAAAVPGGLRVQPVRLQVAAADIELSPEELSARMIIQTIAENIDLLVMPDVVWGLRITEKAAAKKQLDRVEQLLTMAAASIPELAQAVSRKQMAGGDFVVFTFNPDVAALRDLMRDIEGLDDEIDSIVEKAEGIELVLAVGIVGDRVIVSVGDSTEHLQKVGGAGKDQGLLGSKPFVPLREHGDKPLTGVTYASEPLMKAIATSAADIEKLADLSDGLVAAAGLPPESAADAKRS